MRDATVFSNFLSVCFPFGAPFPGSLELFRVGEAYPFNSTPLYTHFSDGRYFALGTKRFRASARRKQRVKNKGRCDGHFLSSNGAQIFVFEKISNLSHHRRLPAPIPGDDLRNFPPLSRENFPFRRPSPNTERSRKSGQITGDIKRRKNCFMPYLYCR